MMWMGILFMCAQFCLIHAPRITRRSHSASSRFGERVLLVDGDEGVLRARVRAREAPVVAQRRGRLLRLLGREMVEAARVKADHGPRRRAGRPRGPVRVFVTFRTLRMGSS